MGGMGGILTSRRRMWWWYMRVSSLAVVKIRLFACLLILAA